MSEDVKEMVVQIVEIIMDTKLKNQSGKEYDATEVIYKDLEGKTHTKGISSTTYRFNKKLRTDLEALRAGDTVVISVKKEGNFYNWVSASVSETVKKEPEQPTKAAKEVVEGGTSQTPIKMAVKSSYETPEERALRQLYIIRQSSLTAALKYYELGLSAGGSGVPEVIDVEELAQEFVDFVMKTKE